jgi:ribonuclease VapC
MIPDASAASAMILGEPGFEVFVHVIAGAESCSISSATFVETTMVGESRAGDTAVRRSDAFFRNARVSIQPVIVDQAYIACHAFSNLGTGRHPASLNFGDCFSYVLAKSTGEPLLFKVMISASLTSSQRLNR